MNNKLSDEATVLSQNNPFLLRNKDSPMQLRFIISASLCGLVSLASANTTPPEVSSGRFGIQAAIATGGTLGMGVVHFTEKTELGFTLSGSYNDAYYQTKVIVPVLFGGLRHAIAERTYFAYGIDLVGVFGRDNGVKIDSNYLVGPYIGLEQMLTNNLMLTGWIQPYQYEYVKKCGASTTTNHFFASGGIGLNYLF